jgi:nitrous oxide reductase accessory protein NosL
VLTLLLLLLAFLCRCCQAAGIQVPADARWAILAPKNAAFADPGILEKTGPTAQQLLQPANKPALTQVTHV